MCGIIGYSGKREVSKILIDGLKKMEYRGYDSSGIAVLNNEKIHIIRSVGKIEKLEKKFSQSPVTGNIGIGHSRWATHGKPSEQNAHPHKDCSGRIALVHNGIIENFSELKKSLQDKGHIFCSDTDTEVVAHLIEEYYNGSLEESFRKILPMLRGAFSLVVLCADEPDKIVFARVKSPLVVGIGKGEYFVASDVTAFLSYAREAVYIENGEMGVITQNSLVISKFDGTPVKYKSSMILWSANMAEKLGFKHFMLKEIYEQPLSISNTLTGIFSENKFELPDANLTSDAISRIKRISIVACGTAYHAGLLGKYFIEQIAKIPVDIDVASEFIYRETLISDESLFIAVSQSGETADTIEAVKEVKAKGARTIAVTNVVGSSITREVDGVIYTRAGLEIGVAATKTFTAQTLIMLLIALYLAKEKNIISEEDLTKYIGEIEALPQKIENVLKSSASVKRVARTFQNCRDFLFLGRNINYPLALEGALKLKEISYIHAEGYAAGEMKHGPIALIDSNCPVVAVMTKSDIAEKMISNVQEVKTRHGIVIGIVSDGDEKSEQEAHYVIKIPKAGTYISTMLSIIPLQLLSYYIADVKGCNVDKPRNLAKTVTVE